MADNRKILTWSLNAGKEAYETDIQKYHNKIYSIGLHDFGVTGEGKIYDYPSGSSALYFDELGNYTGVKMKIANENHIIQYPGIEWYIQTILFGWSKVKPFLDNPTAQDTFLSEAGRLFDEVYKVSRNSGTPLNLTGLEMDMEASMSGDTEADGYDGKYIAFLTRLKNEVCIPRGLKLRVNSYAMWGDYTPYYYRFHNYRKFATATDSQGNAVIDELQVMTYDFAWSGSAPGASTPIWWFEDVGKWASECFDPANNPNAKLTIDNVLLGVAGYGNRWGLFDSENLRGNTITFRNLLGWQNGLYRHYHYDETQDLYVYHNQEFLLQNGFEDILSKNQLMLQHVYDYGKAEFADYVPGIAHLKTYNKRQYLTSYSRTQQAKFGGVQAVKTSADSLVGAGNTANLTYTANKYVGDTLYTFQGYTTKQRQYEPVQLGDGSVVCGLEDGSDGQIIYNIDGVMGTHKLIALVSFPWYSMNKIGGTYNGTPFTIGGESLEEWYPLYFKSAHFYDMGTFDFTGSDEIIIDGTQTISGVPILGFVVCDTFEDNFAGGSVDFDVNPQPFIKKDRTEASIPSSLALTTEMLRQDARPVILWEDYFAQYITDNLVQAYGLEATTYYKVAGTYTYNGTNYDSTDNSCKSDPVQAGFSYGHWEVVEAEPGQVVAKFDRNAGTTEGQLMLNHEYTGNIHVQTEARVTEGDTVGLRFGAHSADDGYFLLVDYATETVSLKFTENGTTNTLAQDPFPEHFERGNKIRIKAIIHNGEGRFYVGYGEKQVFGGAIALPRTDGGACGVIASNTVTSIYMLSIATTDVWETMEKFEIYLDDVLVAKFGEIERPGYTYNKWGFLEYSGINELETRTTETSGVSLDYQFFIKHIPGFQGGKKLTIKMVDPGMWLPNFYLGDSEGCSITYAGDAETFNHLMNLAVDKYGCKGLGLWTMGQEDPKLFEMVADTN